MGISGSNDFFIFPDSSCPANLEVWTCPTCGKSYKHKQSLTNHRKFECGVEKKFQCQICLKWFRYKWGLNSHLITVHKQFPNK